MNNRNRLLVLTLVVAILAVNSASCFSVNVIKSFVDVTAGVVKKIPDTIPSPGAIFSTSKNLVAGYPIEAIISAVHLFCSAALSSKSVEPKVLPDLREMNFILMTPTGNRTFPLNDATSLWLHPEFHINLPMAFMVTGWNSNVNETNNALQSLYEAYACRGGYNFVAVDTAKYVDTLYSWSAFNTEEIGNLIAIGLVELTKLYPIDLIHLIGNTFIPTPNVFASDVIRKLCLQRFLGHSLGAHIVGSAGRNYNNLTGKLLPRITGLDPANPCFNEGESLSGLSRGDADFVDIIHSNPGILGKRDPLGDADFYPNGFDPLPPGCLSITCAHSRAYEFFSETVYPGNENGFEGVKCSSLIALNSGYCNGKKYAMGFAVPKGLKGNFFLHTNQDRPFGKFSKSQQDIVCA